MNKAKCFYCGLFALYLLLTAYLQSTAVAGRGARIGDGSGQSGHWIFDNKHIRSNQVADITGNGFDGRINGPVNVNPAPQALILDGSGGFLELAKGPLPKRHITLEAWAEAEKSVNWAGIVNYIQDNGTFEHGWILGQNEGAFMFGISTGRITYLSAKEPFEPGRWYHIVGTYNGKTMILYINGNQAGIATSQSGDISYVDSKYLIGRYQDNDEAHDFNGMIAEVAVYDRVLTAKEVRDRYKSRKKDFIASEPISAKTGPYIHFERKGEITAYWQSETAVASVLEYGYDPNLGMVARDNKLKKAHTLKLSVRPETTYYYRIVIDKEPTKTFQFYSAFDYGTNRIADDVNPYPADEMTAVYKRAAEFIVGIYGREKGICVDYGCGLGRLAFEISKRSNLKVIGFESDQQKVALARAILDGAGVYGTNIVIHQADLKDLECRDYIANLVVSAQMISSGECPDSSAEMFRILRPDGGKAVLGRPDNSRISIKKAALQGWLGKVKHSFDTRNGLWVLIERGPLDGAGSWDHFYANPANNTNSGEARITGNLQLLWYGQPGPRYITDRHNRPMSSLYKNGIMLTPGHDRLMAYDAYNGTRYWDMAIPGVTRVAVLRDCGWISLADNVAYVVHGKNCVALNLKTGLPKAHFTTPQLLGDEVRNWGFIANQADRLYGTGQKPGVSIIGQNHHKIMTYVYGDKRTFATSDFMFCMDRHTGKTRWTYRNPGGSAIINPTITLSDEAVFFLESRNPEAVNQINGRVNADILLAGDHEYLVKLNSKTGKVTWQKQVELPFVHIMYLLFSAKHNLVVAVGTKNIEGKVLYDQLAFSADEGSLKWATNFTTALKPGGSHGEQEQHPCIVGDTMYMRYHKVNMSDGSATAFGLARSGCGTESACVNFLFGRRGNPYMYSLPSGAGIALSGDTRPGCWINIYPVGGLVMIPESSSGCTCPYPLQTTMVFQPK